MSDLAELKTRSLPNKDMLLFNFSGDKWDELKGTEDWIKLMLLTEVVYGTWTMTHAIFYMMEEEIRS